MGGIGFAAFVGAVVGPSGRELACDHSPGEKALGVVAGGLLGRDAKEKRLHLHANERRQCKESSIGISETAKQRRADHVCDLLPPASRRHHE